EATPTTCFHHTDRPAGRHCTRCGRPACSDCLITASVGSQCFECVKAGAPTRSARLRTQMRGENLLATKLIIAITVAVYLYAGVVDGPWSGNGAPSDKLLLWGPYVHQGDYYRLLTDSVVHFGFTHILFNMLLLWIIGSMFEPVTGHLRFAMIYVVSVLT